MNPTHQEFFVKLLRLCREFDVKIAASRDIGVEVLFRDGIEGRFSFSEYQRHYQNVVEHIRRPIKEYEEPQP